MAGNGNKSFIINNLYSSILLSFILIFILALSITDQLNSSLAKTTKILKLHPKKANAHNINSIRYSSILAVGKQCCSLRRASFQLLVASA